MKEIRRIVEKVKANEWCEIIKYENGEVVIYLGTDSQIELSLKDLDDIQNGVNKIK